MKLLIGVFLIILGFCIGYYTFGLSMLYWKFYEPFLNLIIFGVTCWSCFSILGAFLIYEHQ